MGAGRGPNQRGALHGPSALCLEPRHQVCGHLWYTDCGPRELGSSVSLQPHRPPPRGSRPPASPQTLHFKGQPALGARLVWTPLARPSQGRVWDAASSSPFPEAGRAAMTRGLCRPPARRHSSAQASSAHSTRTLGVRYPAAQTSRSSVSSRRRPGVGREMWDRHGSGVDRPRADPAPFQPAVLPQIPGLAQLSGPHCCPHASAAPCPQWDLTPVLVPVAFTRPPLKRHLL